MSVEGVNRKSRILFSFQLLSFDDNEMRQEPEEEEPGQARERRAMSCT